MIFYTDGSSYPTNPSQTGGYGVVILDHNENLIDTCSMQFKEATPIVTNNRMEMQAIIYAAEYAGKAGETARIYSDSIYAINAFTKWADSWERNGWVKSNGFPPENLDLIKKFRSLPNRDNIELNKVVAHCGIKYNELADKLAYGHEKLDKF